MKSTLGKALLITVSALAVTGVSAPAYAHVAAGQEDAWVATADEPFFAEQQHGFAVAGDVCFVWSKQFIADSESAASMGSSISCVG